MVYGLKVGVLTAQHAQRSELQERVAMAAAEWCGGYGFVRYAVKVPDLSRESSE